MGRTFTREEVIGRLKDTARSGRPIVGSGASVGIVAKCAELGGTDFIIVYSTGKSRIMGLPTRILGDSNRLTLEMHEEIWQVVDHTPIITGIDANDPCHMDHRRLLKKFLNAGVSGMIHCPQVSLYGPAYRHKRDSVGHGFSREMELTSLCRENGLFTMVYCFTPEDAIDMARAGTDCVVAHAGATRGGLVGYKGRDYDTACDLINGVLEAAKGVNPDIICLAHGGPFAEPEDTKVMYERTVADGFIGASSMERIPLENAIIGAVKEFKAVPVTRY